MNIRLQLIILLVLAIGGLAFLNWEALTAVSTVSFGFTEAQAPLGLILLSLMTILGVFFLAYILWLKGTVILDYHRHTKELKHQRELADKAEASRFTELREFLVKQHQESQEILLNKIDALEEHLYHRADDSDNSTAAYLGQIEEQLRHVPNVPQLEVRSTPTNKNDLW